MKKLLVAGLLILAGVSFIFAQSTNETKNTGKDTTKNIMLKGTIIDNLCAAANKDKLAEFIKTHTKECTLMSSCVASGYSIYSDNKLYKFDKASNKKIENFLKTKDSKLDVEVKAKKLSTGELKLLNIQNQK